MSDKKKPDIRFKGFTDDWEQRKAKELCSISTGKSNTQDQINEGKYPFFIRSDVPVKSDKYLYDCEAVITIGDGNIGKVFHYINGKFDLHQRCYKMSDFKDILGKYFYYYFSTKFYDRAMKMTAKATVDSVRLEMISEMDILKPKKKNEQYKIYEILNYLDNLITLHQRKHEKLVNVKKSMLEKMFPRNGKNIPDIRFKGFTDDWEQRKLGEMADYKKGPFGSTLKKEIFVSKSENSVKVYEQQNAINKNWKLERYYITKEYASELKAFETHAGDILVSCAGTIGEMYELPDYSEVGIINQALMRVRVNEKVVSKKIYKLIFSNMIDDFSKEHSNGSAMKNIPPFVDLKSMYEMIPSFNEQEKIGFFFQYVDTLITLHQREIEKLQNIKKSLLKKMFI